MSKYTVTECATKKWPHNQRCRYVDGFYCEDCGIFFSKDTETYLRGEHISNISLCLWNATVDFRRANKKIPNDLQKMEKKFSSYRAAYTKPIDIIRADIISATIVLNKYGKTDKDATFVLKA